MLSRGVKMSDSTSGMLRPDVIWRDLLPWEYPLRVTLQQMVLSPVDHHRARSICCNWSRDRDRKHRHRGPCKNLSKIVKVTFGSGSWPRVTVDLPELSHERTLTVSETHTTHRLPGFMSFEIPFIWKCDVFCPFAIASLTRLAVVGTSGDLNCEVVRWDRCDYCLSIVIEGTWSTGYQRHNTCAPARP